MKYISLSLGFCTPGHPDDNGVDKLAERRQKLAKQVDELKSYARTVAREIRGHFAVDVDPDELAQRLGDTFYEELLDPMLLAEARKKEEERAAA